jgi:hypothetical protein
MHKQCNIIVFFITFALKSLHSYILRIEIFFEMMIEYCLKNKLLVKIFKIKKLSILTR